MIDLILPRYCPCCGRVLLPGEDFLCLRCLAELPRVRAERPGNELERRLFGRFPLQHATTLAFYTHQSPIAHVVRQAKFGDRPWLNDGMARLLVSELQQAADADGVTGWPYDIDAIVPIPVHWLRRLGRGYNQSQAIAEALGDAWHLPVVTGCLYKKKYTASQIGLSGSLRLGHEAGTFGVRRPERLAHRHVLLVDDVLTTGATIVAAADALIAAVPDVRLSVLTLTMAQ